MQMSMLPGRERALHRRERWDSDFYVEPEWAVEALFEAVTFAGSVHDPAAGSGTIPRVAARFGYEATGTDLIDRGRGFPVQNFLNDWTPRQALVFNAPYGLNEAFIEHGLKVGTEVAAIVRLPFLAGQERWRTLYSVHPAARVLIMAERPSMPPGDTDVPARGGTTDYCWIYWRCCHRGGTVVQWLPPRPVVRPATRTAHRNQTPARRQARFCPSCRRRRNARTVSLACPKQSPPGC
jgi:hypothetical protein